MANSTSCRLLAVAAAVLTVLPATLAQENFDYSQQPIPNPFRLGDRYPNRPETDVCRPIFDHIVHNSDRFTNELVLNTNREIAFATDDARRMTSRMQTRLDRLRQLYTGYFTVLKAWTEYPDPEVLDSTSLHYEGRTLRVHVHDYSQISKFLKKAVQAAFDWVFYDNSEYVRLSVIPDNCENNVDMVFILDQSGSVGRTNHGLAIQFILNLIQFFSIAPDATRVGFVAFSRRSHIEFDLNDYTTAHSVANRIRNINYRGGSTSTALGLEDAAYLLNSASNRGARSASEGIPKVAILITDGKSNNYPLGRAVRNIKRLGVQVYTIGIDNPDVDELQFISSDPDSQHVFLLNSYNDAAGFVDFLSIQTCDSPAIIDPGDNTTTDVPEDGIRYFQVECDSFSNRVLVELYDNTGTSFLYCSATEKNPGPLTSDTVSDTSVDTSIRTCEVLLANADSKVVYIGVHGREDNNQFTVVVWDLLFTPDRDRIVVLEGAIGSVYDVSTNLNAGAHGIEFEYRIIEGNSDGIFTINDDGQVLVPQTGLVVTENRLYTLTIMAKNKTDECQSARFKLSIRVGGNEIYFFNLAPVSIPETATTGTEVTTIQATGGAGLIEYSIVNSNVPFTIEQATGRLVLDGILNFEEEEIYNVVINAESVGTAISGSVTQVIFIKDVNEQPEWETSCAQMGKCVEVVQENQASRSVGGRLVVTDPDLPSVANGQIQYRIVTSDSQLPFSISSNGQVRTTEPLDREERPVHLFTVIAEDQGNPPLSASTTFHVTVEDVNDEAPSFIQGPAELSVPENEPMDTVLTQYIATDRDKEPNAQITYSLSSELGTGLPFRLDPHNGALNISGILDYEDPANREFHITVTANNPPLSNTTTTLIRVTDVNDNMPIFEQESYAVSVPEHSPQSSIPVLTVRATDADSGLNGDIRYAIITRGNYFTIDRMTGALTVVGDIDREQVGSVELTIGARDRGSPRQGNSVKCTITISDINDHRPIFDPELYILSLREDRRLNSVAFTVFATDADKPDTENSQIVYSIQDGNIGDAFRIESATGIVRINRGLDHEDTPSYILIIKAADQGSPQMSATATANVTVMNVNEAPPTLSDDQTVYVHENAPVDFVVATFTASDADFMPVNIGILSGNDEGKFRISGEGDIAIAELLDFESTENFVLIIQASDGAQTDLASLVVNVVDVNEFTPEFSGPASFDLAEELPAGTVVGTVNATDADGSAPNNKIEYAFSTRSSIQDYFHINSSSGVITTASVLDRETLTDVSRTLSSSLLVEVFARDGGSPSLQNSRVYTITLIDINDNKPQFREAEYSHSLYENLEAQTVLLFLATDADSGSNADIIYSFTVDPQEGEPLFELVDNHIGEISTTQSLDCELQTSYSFIITATDQGNPSQSSNVSGTVLLRDRNDNLPVFRDAPYVFIVDEDAPFLSTIGQVVATDADKSLNGEVFYEILGQEEEVDQSERIGGSKTFFEINTQTGEIQHVTPLNFETFPEITITVGAYDMGRPQRSSTAQVVIAVRNVDEIAPYFSRSCTNVEISENVPVNFLVANCMAFDVDNTTTADNTEWITYAIEPAGNIGNTFTIGLHDGIIRNAIKLDYETTNAFRLHIHATDGSSRSRTRIVDIDIEDENDNAPVFQASSYYFEMTSQQIVSNTQRIVRVRASDSDSGRNGDVSYSIDTGDISRVSSTETRITITARDGGDTPQVTTVVLTVEFDSECLLQRYRVHPKSGDVWAHVLCSVQASPEHTDVVMENDHTSRCYVVTNSHARYQWLLNGSAIDIEDQSQEGTLNVRRVGFQDGGTYACKVTTEAGSLQTSTYTVNILVAPTITVPPRSTAVLEGGNMEFTCFAVGRPTPLIHWEFKGTTVGTGNTLRIDNADGSVQGTYSCVAVSTAGSSSATTTLAVFVTDNVAKVFLKNVDQASSDGSCYYLDPEKIEDVVMSFSGVSTLVTSILADNLCEINSCSPNPCGNGGSCQLDKNVRGGYICACPDGYTGVDCMDDINECLDDPCGPSGECSNVYGLFRCVCSGSTGNRCQYPSTCTDDSCSDGKICLESPLALNGHVCIVPGVTVVLRVTKVHVDPGFLDELLVNYREALLQQLAAANNQNTKRASNDQLTATFASSGCSPRFIPLEQSASGSYGLVWDCPEGEPSPPQETQAVLCQVLLQSRLVASCQASPDMPVQTLPPPPPPLPKTSVTVELIQVDNSGEPLSIGETLKNLAVVAEELQNSGFLQGAEVDSVSAVNPIVCTSECVNGECTDRDTCTCEEGWTGATCSERQDKSDQQKTTDAGVIAGATVAVIVGVAVVIATGIIIFVLIRKYQEHKRKQELKVNYARELENMSSARSTMNTQHTSSTQQHYEELPLPISSLPISSSTIKLDNNSSTEQHYEELPLPVSTSTIKLDDNACYYQLPVPIPPVNSKGTTGGNSPLKKHQ